MFTRSSTILKFFKPTRIYVGTYLKDDFNLWIYSFIFGFEYHVFTMLKSRELRIGFYAP